MPAPAAARLAVLFLVLLPALVDAKAKRLPCAPDAFADPKTDPCNPLEYIASNTLTAIAVGLLLVVGIAHVYNTWKWGAKWMSAMTIGIFTFLLGLACRFGLHSNPQSKGIYIVQYLFVVLSPCAFIAADYVLLGHLAIDLDSPEHLIISPRRVMPVFIASDITTFLIQAAGGSVSISANDVHTNQVGSNIFLGGLVIQLVSFFLFTCMFLLFVFRISRHKPSVWHRDTDLPWYADWRMLAATLALSCAGILVRSVFRVIELSEGFKGPLATNEGAFYGLDTLPLFIAVAVYVPFWPGRFVPRRIDKEQERQSDGSVDEVEAKEASSPREKS